MKKINTLITFLMLTASFSFAQWDGSTGGRGTAVYSNPAFSFEKKISVSDGSNGSIIVSHHYDGSGSKISAQRINANGALQWGAANSPKMVVQEDLTLNAVIPDGAGGAYIAASVYDNEYNENVYIQHINNSGNITWGVGGIKISNSTTGSGTNGVEDVSHGARLCTDGAGGVIVTWNRETYDNIDEEVTYSQVLAQRYNSGGTAFWTAGGVALSTAAGFRAAPEMVTDGAGGAIIFFADSRNSPFVPGEDYNFPNIDIYAQRISAAGNRMWTNDGVSVCTEQNIQITGGYDNIFYAASDGVGGGILVFEDYRLDNDGSSDLYAQRLNSAGVKQWTTSGVVVCNFSGDQRVQNVVPNGSQGIVVLWADYRNSSNDRLYTQQIGATGSALWTANGILLNGTSGNSEQGDIKPDGSGNYIYTWVNDENEVKAQKLGNAGNEIWGTNGLDVSLSSAYSFYGSEVVISDNAKAIVTYFVDSDNLGGIYAKKIETNGVLPLNLLDFTAVPAQAKVLLKWSTASEENTKHFELERSTDNLNFKNIGKVSAAGNSSSNRGYDFTDGNPVYGNNYYRLKQVDKDGTFTYSPIKKVIFGANNSVVLLSNPVKSEAVLKYVSSQKNKVQVRITDVLGKVVLTQQVMVEAGTNQVRLETNGLTRGIYEVELISSTDRLHVRMMKD